MSDWIDLFSGRDLTGWTAKGEHPPRGHPGKSLGTSTFTRTTAGGFSVIHENVECTGPTRGAWSSEDVPGGPLRLQGDHGPVAYRNIRMRPSE
jgi:hypothetical protein